MVNEEGRDKSQTANEGQSVKKGFDTFDKSHSKSDDDFKQHLWTALMSFKRAELRKQRDYNTPEEVIAHVCKDVAANHRIFLDDIRAAWERLANDPDLIHELDAVMNDETGGTV